jgi:CheY-like chemotaxis protein
MNGIEFLEELRSDEKNTPFLMTTSNEDSDKI